MSTSAHESIGARLTAARTAAGLTVAAAAARLRCDESLLMALEAERFADVGAPVFVQGHLRRYADLLGLPTETLLADWATLHRNAISAPDLTQVPRPNRPVLIVDPGKIARPLAMLAAAVVIALAAWWILQGAGTTVPSTAAVVETPPIAPAEIEPAAAIAEVTNGSSMAEPATSSSTAPMLQAATADPAVPASTTTISTPTVSTSTRSAPAASAPSTSPVGSGVLALAVSDECWVEIVDATGTRRYFALVPGGERLSVSGPAPWRVVMGRADAVTLEVGGRRLTIPAALVRNATAYVSVDAAGRVQSAEGSR